MAEIEPQWYWDRRTETAIYPCRVGEDTVEFVTVRHREAVADAVAADALVPLDPASADPDGDLAGTLDFVDSFRLLDEDALSRYTGN